MPQPYADVIAALTRLADELEDEAEGAEPEKAVKLLRRVLVLRRQCEALGKPEGLRAGESSTSLQPMTGAQLQRRGKAIAKTLSAKSKDRLWQAIVSSKWGSQERYARERLRVSPGSLSAYRSGATACPRPVAAKVEADFGIGADYWPRPLVD